ncbi:endo-1,4-beta-xylanase [Planctomycetota bacterium]
MKFQVFKNGKAVSKFDLFGAYLFGGDGIAIRRAQIHFNNGFVFCKKPTLQTAGLTLLWDVDGFGSVLLQTTCLPERDRPYILNIELARAKLMQIINKREEWSLFNNTDEQTKMAKEAQDLFIQAVQNVSEPSTASRLADESLKRAVVVSENLANKQAEVLLEERSKSHGFGRGCLGCVVDPGQINNPRYIKSVLALSGFATIPVNWGRIERRKGEYDFSGVDACVKALSHKRLVIGAGPLLRFSEEHIPAWLIDSGAGFEKVREAAYRFVSEMVSRYTPTIRAWRIISGLNAFNHFGFSFEQVLEMTRAATMAVKTEGNRSLKIIDIANPWGEYYAQSPNTISPLVYVDMVVQSGINFDAFGLQMQVGKDRPGMHVRDMMQISAVIDLFAPAGKPVHITKVEVTSKSSGKTDAGKAGGLWHDEWSQTLQAQWLEQFYKIVLSKPFVDTVTYSHLTDAEDNTIEGSGLLMKELKPKKSFLVLKKLRKHLFGG